MEEWKEGEYNAFVTFEIENGTPEDNKRLNDAIVGTCLMKDGLPASMFRVGGHANNGVEFAKIVEPIVIGLFHGGLGLRANRQGFSHRGADAKSLLDEAFRRGMGGAAGVRMAMVGAVRAVDGNGPAV